MSGLIIYWSLTFALSFIFVSVVGNRAAWGYIALSLVGWLALTASGRMEHVTPEQMTDSALYILYDGGYGSAFAIDDHTIITAAHVVDNKGVTEYPITNDRQTTLSQLIFADRKNDVAVIHSTKSLSEQVKRKLVFPKIDCEDEPYIGQEIVSIGYPGAMGPLLTYGRVVYLGPAELRTLPKQDYAPGTITVNLPIYPGMSGSMVVDLRGNLTGLVSRRFVHQSTGEAMDYGIVVPTSFICDALAAVKEKHLDQK